MVGGSLTLSPFPRTPFLSPSLSLSLCLSQVSDLGPPCSRLCIWISLDLFIFLACERNMGPGRATSPSSFYRKKIIIIIFQFLFKAELVIIGKRFSSLRHFESINWFFWSVNRRKKNFFFNLYRVFHRAIQENCWAINQTNFESTEPPRAGWIWEWLKYKTCIIH